MVDYQYARECLILEEPFTCEVFEQYEKSLLMMLACALDFVASPNKNKTFQSATTIPEDSITKVFFF